MGDLRRVRAGGFRPVLGACHLRALRARDPSDIRPDAAGDGARTLGRPCPRGARRGHAGVHGTRARRLGVARQMENLAEDLPPIATTSERRSRTFAALAKAAPSRRCRKRSKASSRAGNTRCAQAYRVAIRRRNLGRHRLCGIRVARSNRRTLGNGRARAGDGHFHASRTPGSARPADWTVRARPIGHHHETD